MGRKRKSMFEPFRDDIVRLLNEGKNIKQAYRILFPNPNSGYAYGGFLHYVNRNGLRFVGENDGYEHVPVCKECQSYISVKRHECCRCDISVCTEEKREISPYVITSPKWCPNRDNKRQGEL